VVTREEAESWARSKGMLFVEASAKTRVGIKQVFNEVIAKVSSSSSSSSSSGGGGGGGGG